MTASFVPTAESRHQPRRPSRWEASPMTTIPDPDSDSPQEDDMSVTNDDPGNQSSGVSMDLMSLVRLMARHWRVTVPAAVLTVMLVVAAFMLKSPSYTAGASVVLFSPPLAPSAEDNPGVAQSTGENPFTRYGDLAVVADIVARKMNGDDIQAELKDEGVTGYTVIANRLTRGPVIDVTGTGPDPATAIGSAKAAVAKFDSVLTEMQEAEGADPAYLITSAPVEPPDRAVAQVGSTMRTAIALLALGGLGTLALAVAAEAFSRRREGAATPGSSSTPDIAADPAPEQGNDHPQPPFGTGRPAVWPVRDPEDDRARPPSRKRRSVKEASEPGPGAQADAPKVSYRTAPRVAAVPTADRQEEKPPGWTIWRPSSLASAPDNGHEKPAIDSKS
jgi:hypothetical protein